MEEIQAAAKFGAFDLLLLGVFFISYNVLALVLVACLFGGRWIAFAAVTVVVTLAAQGGRWLDFRDFCAERSSVIVCGEERQELVALGSVWIIVCAAILVIFLLLQVIRRRREGRPE
jgi:hypothetical protein